jgi:hypothetical protein
MKAIAETICPGKACPNGASVNSDCSCLCSGLWSGKGCDECDANCGEHGKKNEADCTCKCAEGHFGTNCEAKVIGYWKDAATIQFEIKLPAESWKGQGAVQWFTDAKFWGKVKDESKEVNEAESVVQFPISGSIGEPVDGMRQYFFGFMVHSPPPRGFRALIF